MFDWTTATNPLSAWTKQQCQLIATKYLVEATPQEFVKTLTEAVHKFRELIIADGELDGSKLTEEVAFRIMFLEKDEALDMIAIMLKQNTHHKGG